MSTPLAQPSPASGPPVTGRRRVAGWIVAVVGPALLSAMLLPLRDQLGVQTVLLLFVLIAVLASAIGGVAPALGASVLGFWLANLLFTRPFGSLSVDSTAELVDLLVFVSVAGAVGLVAEWGARARAGAERARLREQWLAGLERTESAPDSVERALAEARRVFAMHRAALVRDGTELAGDGWADAGDVLIGADAGDGLRLQLTGPERIGVDRVLLDGLATTTGRLWRTRELAADARRGQELARVDELRTALLTAVGHDLRNPLAAIGAAAATLREPGLALTDAERAELLGSIEQESGRLNTIIADLLDAGRLRAGALTVQRVPTRLREVLAEVVQPAGERLEVDVPDDLPALLADPGLLARVLANLVDNAVRHGGGAARLSACAEADGVAIRVVDHGPGIAEDRWAEVFAPFQHFGDRSSGGVGLGLALARGFTEAMGGTLTPSATPGGGLTMTVLLEAADEPGADR